jgi:hypothetical protein
VSDLLAGIRDRRRLNTEQALALLGAAASADAATKRSLLAMASRCIADPAVLDRWVGAAASEPDADIKAAMIARASGADPHQIGDMPQFIGLMTQSVGDPPVRSAALHALSRLAVSYPGVADCLEEAYAGQPSAGARRQILIGLCQFHRPAPALAGFLAAHADDADGDVKPLIVDRLLRAGAVSPAMLAGWLEPQETAAVKQRVLAHVVDRSLPLVLPVAGVLRGETDAAVRLLAVRALAAQAGVVPATPALGAAPEGQPDGPPLLPEMPAREERAAAVQALLDAVRDDPDPRVRSSAVAAFQQSVEPTPGVLAALVASLRTETSAGVASLVLASLVPFASTSLLVRDALVDLAGENLRAELATTVLGALGELLRWEPALLGFFLERYRVATDDRARTVMLQALAQYPDADERLHSVYRDALSVPSPGARQWGLVGLLRVPMTPEHVELVAAGVGCLTDATLDTWLRRALARKIARIPDPSPELRAALDYAASHTDDQEVRAICRRALVKSTVPEDVSQLDLRRWCEQVEVEGNVDGVFPDVFACYDTNPAVCSRILKSSVLSPACRENLYQGEFRVSDTTIISFLISRDAFDDDLCRYCVEAALVSQGPAWYLRALACRPSFAGLPDAVWRLIEGIKYSSENSHNLVRGLMTRAFGGEGPAAEALRQRLAGFSSPATARPYIRFLAGVYLWPPAGPLIAELLRSRSLVDAVSLEILGPAVHDLFPELAAPPPKPGLAED